MHAKKSIKRKSKRISEYALAEWKRVVLNPLWRIYVWTFLAEIVLLVLYVPTQELPRTVYFTKYVGIPLGEMLLVILCLHVFLGRIARRLRTTTVAIFTIIFLNLYIMINLCSFSNLSIMMIAVFFPIIIAPIYKKKELVYIQVLISLGMLLFCEIIYIPTRTLVPTATPWMYVIVMLLLFYAMVKFELEVITSTNMLDLQSSKDSLTHLMNHEAFYEALDDHMNRFTETKETFTIIISDIDNFKKVNDTYGHAFGDEVIKRVAEITMDCKGTRDVCARYGGEEFAIILPNKNLNDAVLQAEKIRQRFENAEFQTEDGAVHHFSISLGVAEYNKEYRTASAFFETADKALYEAKRLGKNRVCCSR